MKKFLSVILSILMLTSVFSGLSITANAAVPTEDDSGTCGENLDWYFDTSAYTLHITGTGDMDDYSTSSKAPWYDYRSYLTYVEIGEGVTSIGSYAFYWGKFSDVKIADSVTKIGEKAFAYCSNLSDGVEISENVTSIGDCAFIYTLVCTGINVDSNNQYYCSVNGALLDKACTRLMQYPLANTAESFAIPDTVTTIDDYAFYQAHNLTEITMGDKVETIGYYSFACCYALTSIVIPDSVTSIDESAFQTCRSLEELTLSDNLTSISPSAFAYCVKLTEVPFSENLTDIGDKAFSNCTALTSVTIPANVTNIGKAAFECSKLEAIYIQNPDCTIYNYVATIGSSATIHGYSGSTAETYASKYSRTFVAFTVGDVNADGTVSIQDATSIQKYLAHLETLTEAQKTLADVNSDGKISIRDVTYIQMYVAKMIETLV